MLGTWSRGLNTNFILGDCFFGAVKLSKTADLDKYGYISYGIGFDVRSQFSLPNGEWSKNVAICGLDKSSSVHTDKKDILQSFTKYFRITIVFMSNSVIRQKFNFYFLRVFCFSFWQEDWELVYHSIKLRHFPDISWFPKILSLKSLGNLWGNWYISCLQVMIAHRFTGSKREIL